MSRAFVKEVDDLPTDLPPREVSGHPNLVTPNGLKQIKSALAKFAAAHQAALAKGNMSAIELTAREVAYWRSRNNSAVPVPEGASSDRAKFGATVTVRRHDGRVQTFRIVGEDEAEPSSGTISYVSPFAQAVLDKPVGAHIEISGEDAEILEIR